MESKDRSGLKKLAENAYFIALNGRSFTDFKNDIELENIYEVKFDTKAYQNGTACQDSISSIATYLFEEELRKKLCRVNFISYRWNN